MCLRCEATLSRRRVEATRDQLMLETYEYHAVYGNKTFVGATFAEVGDHLAGLGYMMAKATKIADATIRVPHPKRHAAAIKRVEKEASSGG